MSFVRTITIERMRDVCTVCLGHGRPSAVPRRTPDPFGVLKLFPGVSPAQGLVERTIDIRTFGLVPGAAALVIAAAVGGARLTGRPDEQRAR